ncbi:MAG: heavy-metal-associated domain-containing protein [Suilimivivens sp.]
MGNVIIIGILVIVVIFAVAGSAKHFKGEGGCCGGGGGTVREYKELTAPKIGEKTLQIEGMHCENCRNRIEHAINKIDGVVCKVSLKKKTATVSYSRQIDEELLKNTVTKLGYEVTGIF